MTERFWSKLSNDLLILILDRLLGKEVIYFRNVCKAWQSAFSLRNATPKKKAITIQETPRSIPPTPLLKPEPWLVMFHGKRSHNQTFYRISEDRCYVKNIPELRKKYFCTCSHGWLVLHDKEPSGDDCFLLNLISMQKIQLPLFKPSFTYCYCVLSSSPTDPDCMVLFIESVYPHDFISITYCRPTIDNDWITRNLKVDKAGITSFISYSGKIYALTESNLMHIAIVLTEEGVVDFVINEVATELPEEETIDMGAVHYHLVESCGELLLVELMTLSMRNNDVRKVKVFKMDFVNKSWTRVRSLGDRAIFISRQTSISYSTKDSNVERDAIYFTLREDKTLYAYHLESKEITKTLPCPNVINNWERGEWILH